MKENKTQSKQAKHNCAFFRLRDDGAAMKAKRTANSIQPIPISAATSQLYVTSRGSPQIPGCWRRQENLQITRYRLRSYGGLSLLSLAAQTAKKSASPNQVYEVAVCWRRFFFWKWRRKRTKPKANKPKTRAYSSGSGMTWLLMTTRTEPPEFAANID